MNSLIRMLVGANLAVFALLAALLLLRHQNTPVTTARQELASLLNQKEALAMMPWPESGKAVVALFSRINTTCGAHRLLQRLQSWKEHHPQTEVVVLLSRDFQEHDADNLRHNLDLPFRVLLAGPKLHQAWNRLESRLAEGTLNGSLFISAGAKESPSRQRCRLRPASSPQEAGNWLKGG